MKFVFDDIIVCYNNKIRLSNLSTHCYASDSTYSKNLYISSQTIFILYFHSCACYSLFSKANMQRYDLPRFWARIHSLIEFQTPKWNSSLLFHLLPTLALDFLARDTSIQSGSWTRKTSWTTITTEETICQICTEGYRQGILIYAS